VKIEQITNKIILVKYNSQKQLCEAFVRFQESYENPVFRNTVFTLGIFRRWYAEKMGTFSYYEDWNGMNIPSYVLKPFLQGLFDPLTEAEQELLDLFKWRTDDFYIIGSCENGTMVDDSTNHEICHGLYYTVPEYRRAVEVILEGFNLSKLKDWLRDKTYCEEVLLDECHAFIMDDCDWLRDEGIDIPEELETALKRVYERHNPVTKYVEKLNA